MHRAAVDGHLRDGAQLHPGVLLDLRDRGTDHVRRGHRFGHRLGQPRPGQHQQTLTVAPQPGRQVVQFEQTGELVRVLLVGLQPVDDPELALHQPLTAAGEVDEDAVDVLPQERLLGGQPDRPLVHDVERPGELADLLPRVHGHGGDRVPGGFDGVRVGQDPPHRLGQPDVGDLQRTRPQVAQRAGQRAGDDEGEHDRGDQRRQRDREEHPRGRGRVDGQPLVVLLQPIQQFDLDRTHLVDGQDAVRPELAAVDAQTTGPVRTVVRGGDQPGTVVHLGTGHVVQIELLLPDRRLGDEGLDGGVRSGPGAAGAVEQVGDEFVVAHRHLEYRVLPCGVFLDLVDPPHEITTAQQFLVRDQRIGAAGAHERLNDRVVDGVGRQRGQRGAVDLRPQCGQPLQSVREGSRARGLPVVGVRRLGQRAHRVVDPGPLPVHGLGPDRRTGQGGHHEGAFALELVHQHGDALGDPDLVDTVPQLARVRQGLARAQTTEDRRGQQGHEQDDGHLVAQRPVAQAPPRTLPVTLPAGTARSVRRVPDGRSVVCDPVLVGEPPVLVRGLTLRHRSTTIVVRAGSTAGFLGRALATHRTRSRDRLSPPVDAKHAEAWRHPPTRVNTRTQHTEVPVMSGSVPPTRHVLSLLRGLTTAREHRM